uniref:dual-specificity kinase n=1 Tax=Gouania willdenowi TaxID=441366 RepID=A0A8C5EG33_GOUWI
MLIRDRGSGECVAVKVVKNLECFQESGRSEVAVLYRGHLWIWNTTEVTVGCVRMLDWFDHQGHVCLVLELLGMNTFTFIQQNHQRPFTVTDIRHMAYTLCRAVCFLHRHRLTHTDVKPENILLVSSDCDSRKLKCLDVKLVDFGTATFDHQHHQSVVSTRHYRAPEIILDLGWNQSCDVWSLGCVLMEFYLGRTLFPTHDSHEHLAMMEKILGPIPTHLLQQTRKQQYVSQGRLMWDDSNCSDHYNQCEPLKHMLRRAEEEELRHLLDLISLMLEYDVTHRISLQEALWHPFFNAAQHLKSSVKSS